MPYTVKSGDTIYDVAFNVAGSMARVDQILEQNTPDNTPMVDYKTMAERNDVPDAHQMESWTPTLHIDQILDVDDVPVDNLEAVNIGMFNSTITDHDEVLAEIDEMQEELNKPLFWVEPQVLEFENEGEEIIVQVTDVLGTGFTAEGMPDWLTYEINDDIAIFSATRNDNIGVRRAQFRLVSLAGDVVDMSASQQGLIVDRVEIAVYSAAQSYSFIVPFSGYAVNGQSFNYDIYVDDEFYDNVDVTVSRTLGTGYEITGLRNGEHVISVRYSGTLETPPIGWARAFGFATGNVGCNNQFNRNLVVRIIHDHDYCFCASETAVGDTFRAYQWYQCVNISVFPDETLGDIKTLTTIGAGFKQAMYQNCQMAVPPKESLPDTIVSIGNYFRYQQFLNCDLLQSTTPEVMPESVQAFGNSFRRQQYSQCISLNLNGHIHTHHIQQLLNTSQSYAGCFNSIATLTRADIMPRYYLDASQTETAPISELTPPTEAKNYITNRTGVAGYADLDNNWKS